MLSALPFFPQDNLKKKDRLEDQFLWCWLVQFCLLHSELLIDLTFFQVRHLDQDGGAGKRHVLPYLVLSSSQNNFWVHYKSYSSSR